MEKLKMTKNVKLKNVNRQEVKTLYKIKFDPNCKKNIKNTFFMLWNSNWQNLNFWNVNQQVIIKT